VHCSILPPGQRLAIEIQGAKRLQLDDLTAQTRREMLSLEARRREMELEMGKQVILLCGDEQECSGAGIGMCSMQYVSLLFTSAALCLLPTRVSSAI
jgi:hypothetical protein